ncbi:pentapeptide repeat-containing protein, partial [Magnetococcales bacterium HHB-1]
YADFRSSQFSGYADFRSSQFSGYADFRSSQFSGYADFRSSQFSGYADFSESQFSGSADFISSQFSGSADFISSQFSGDADFRSSQFSGYADFSESQFLKSAHFSLSVFDKTADFKKVIFKDRLELDQAKFHDEVIFEASHQAFIKNVQGKNLNFKGAILEAAHLWEITVLEKCDFRDAFLISLSLAEKNLIDCNFTGAVFDAVQTRGWKPDDATLNNTKYIYTNYTKEDVFEEGREVTLYKRDEDSRVPAGEGVFGEGDYQGFRLDDYLKEPYKWSFAQKFPPIMRSSIINYINLFPDFMRLFKDVNVDVATKKEGEYIRFEFQAKTLKDKKRVRKPLEEFLMMLKTGEVNLSPEADAHDGMEQKFYILKLEHEISNLRSQLKYTEFLLESEKEKGILKKQIIEEKETRLQEFKSLIQDPRRMLTEKKPHNKNIYIMNADIAGYSRLPKEYIDKHVPEFMAKQIRFIREALASRQDDKEAGDGLLAFFESGEDALDAARRFIRDLEDLQYQCPSIQGGRVQLGFGSVTYYPDRGAGKMFTGEAIIHTTRIDQPMKNYIKQQRKRGYDESNYQIWCSENFYLNMKDVEKPISFQSISQIEKSKDNYDIGMVYAVKMGG